jgi:hypothetical protein
MGFNSPRFVGQALGEEALPQVPVKGTRGIIFIFFSFFPQFFVRSSHTILNFLFKFELFLNYFGIFH